jgi:aminoglycoside phosphotransferase (APT) family kinase protein
MKDAAELLLREAHDVTPEVLTDLLSELHPDARVRTVEVRRAHQGSASHLHLSVTYEDGASAGLPERLFLKTQLSTVLTLPSYMAEMLSKSATATLLATETRFYKDVRPTLELEVPVCFAVRFLPDPTQFVLLTEDLAERQARFPNPKEPLSVDDVDATLTTLAQLHAAFWGSPRLDGDLAWLRQADASAPSTPEAAQALFDVIRATFAEPGKAEALAASGFDADGMQEAFMRTQALHPLAPQTLLHGDSHLANIYYLNDGVAGLLDWQLCRIGGWFHDVTYHLTGALSPEDRRANEQDLLRLYLERLAGHGVARVPDWDEAWLAYRSYVPWGFPMWSITPPEMYDDGAVVAVMQRQAQAMVDLRTAEALGMA